MNHRISIDVGGTFTDAVVTGDDGALHIGKALTTPGRAFPGVRAALEATAPAMGTTADELLRGAAELRYGTTRTTNAIVEGRTARTALLTTAGFPDVLLLREGGKPGPFRQMEYPPPYVPRHLTFEIDERIDAEATVHRPLDEASVLRAIEQIRARRCEAVAVCLLWSVVEPAHELRVGELLAEHLPDVPFTLSHRLNPVVREYRRASSAAIDASLKPLMQDLVRTLERDLDAAGFRGRLLLTTSFGGAWTADEIAERPIYSIGSGPSMAPVAALRHARADLPEGADGREDLLVCDTGGTTFDVGMVTAGEPHVSADTWLGGRWIGHLTGTRSVDVRSIGSGGGSIVWIDPGGLLRVGPRSAGSEPGPACYGRGGTEPTVTDAAVVLGYLEPDRFLGGRLELDAAAAERAFAPVAER
ncbi:hydantoinase/oxoprolinase family protein, partial [Patulibacter sp. S7RM1-6]